MMKYIRTKHGDFYVFHMGITHTDFARCNYIIKKDIISAGFIYGGQCRDKSVSLNIAAGPTDTADLMEQMGTEALK